MDPRKTLTGKDAVIAVDIQKDFCPGGALAVPEGDAVVSVMNAWLEAAAQTSAMAVASRDWHPVGHCSFKPQGGPWPEHCVQDTPGAEFHPDLRLDDETVRVSKGTAFDKDAYSAFDGTGLGGFLRDYGVERLWIGGLAEDVCVLATVKEACKQGFETHLLVPATRAVEPDKADDVLAEMREAGAILEDDV